MRNDKDKNPYDTSLYEWALIFYPVYRHRIPTKVDNFLVYLPLIFLIYRMGKTYYVQNETEKKIVNEDDFHNKYGDLLGAD